MRSRRAGRTYEGMLIVMGLMVVAAIVAPGLVRTDLSAPPEDAPAVAMAAAPDLSSPRAVDTGAWLTSTTAVQEAGAVVVTTRPAGWVRAVVAPVLLLLGVALASLLVTEDSTGWRPGGTPAPPGRVERAARVAAYTVLNPLGLAALGVLLLTTRLEVRKAEVRLHPIFGAPTTLAGVTDATLLALDDERARLVVVHAPRDGVARSGVLTLARPEAGVARAVRDALR